MVYKILIKGVNNNYAYATTKVELMEEIKGVDAEGNETSVFKPTGKYKVVIFETEDVEVLKEKYVELAKSYKIDELNCIADVSELATISLDVEEVVPKGDEPVNPDEPTNDPTDDENDPEGPAEETDVPEETDSEEI